ncbi:MULTISPECIES: hypothetical protein [unclassified Shewanella]|uniref:hypothetical protein n=1 Tax=unclassified Shewanella TaxID=196818 RepID=UPI0020A79E26|nr:MULTISPECIES: hypothetical protein [unclassified Shewanella]MCP3128794.1 hypothetical protein [Shewanella sp. KJ2020]MDT3322421.1 hypothetical protein [Shewanella sp. SP1S2-4]
MVSEQFEWALLALAQPAKVQLGLFPDFSNAADELALSWEEALEDTNLDELPDSARSTIKELDDYMLSISGQENAGLWTNDSVSNSVQWAKMRKMANKVIKELGWIKSSPHKPSWAIYVHDDEST